jgi:hypothetical protein
MGRTISDSTTMMLKATNSTPLTLLIPQEDWENISYEARFHGNVNLVSWNPLLKTEQDRLEFEKFAQKQTFAVGAEPQCFLCGSADRGYKNLDELTIIPGFGTYTCGLLEDAGLQGVIPAENCAHFNQLSREGGCECYDLPPGTERMDETVTIPKRIFRIDSETGESVEEPNGSAPYLPRWSSSVLEIREVPILHNQMSVPSWKDAIDTMLETSFPVLSETYIRSGPYYRNYAGFLNEPSTILQFPVILEDEIVGSISFEVRWSSFLSFVFPPLSHLVDIVIENSFGQNFTYGVDAIADVLVLKGKGDLHDRSFGSSHSFSSTFEEYDLIVKGAAPELPPQGAELNYCRYRYHVFATQEYEGECEGMCDCEGRAGLCSIPDCVDRTHTDMHTHKHADCRLTCVSPSLVTRRP